jgi:putative inorganic carbon (hco3(-)) transporter
MVSLGFYMISPELNDLFTHYFGFKSYVSVVSAILLTLAFLASGSAGRGLKLPIGRYWALFSLLLVCTVPFSTWPRASLGELGSYIPRGILFFFAIAAFVMDVTSVKFFFLMETVRGFLLLLCCALWGSSSGPDERFLLGGSSFYANSNDLGLALTTVIGFFLYQLIQKGVGRYLFGAVGFLGDIFFLLKTGSRGGFLAIGVVIGFSLLFSARYRSRLLSMLVMLPFLVLLIPQDTLRRLTYIFADPTSATVTSDSDTANLLSQIERTQLFWKSVHMLIAHPLLGVGIGEFPDALYLDDVEKHTHSAALGTHNSYTQVGAECGFPALMVYLLIVITASRMNYRIFRRTMADERLAFFPPAALSLLASTVGFAVGSAFHHVAWTTTLPLLTGASAGLWQACQKEALRLGRPDLLKAEDPQAYDFADRLTPSAAQGAPRSAR